MGQTIIETAGRQDLCEHRLLTCYMGYNVGLFSGQLFLDFLKLLFLCVFFCFDFAIFDLVHDLKAIFYLPY